MPDLEGSAAVNLPRHDAYATSNGTININKTQMDQLAHRPKADPNSLPNAPEPSKEHILTGKQEHCKAP